MERVKNFAQTLFVVFIALAMQYVSVSAQSINTIKQQCQSPFQSDYGSVKITAAGDIYLTPCPTKNIFPPISGLVSPLTTKGDIWGWNTTNARIPVGTDGQVLTANSLNALGVSWQTPSGISGLTVPYIPIATSATTLGNSPLSWNGTFYKFDNAALNSTWNMALVPSSTTGLFYAGDTASCIPAVCLTNHIRLDQAAGFFQAQGNSRAYVGGGISGTSYLNIEDGLLQAIGGNSAILQATNTNVGGINVSINLDSPTRTILVDDTADSGLFDLAGMNRVRFQNGTAITPTTAGAGNNIGTTLLPFSSLFIGAAATNNIQLTGTATGTRVITLPDATGTVALQGGSGTISGLTAGAIPKAASATTLANSNYTDDGGGAGASINLVGGSLIDLTANAAFRFISGIFRLTSDCAGKTALNGSGSADLSATTCYGLAGGTRIILITGNNTTGILTVDNTTGIVTSDVGAADAGNDFSYWIIDTP